MSHLAVAVRAGLTQQAIEELIDGRANMSVAMKLGVLQRDLEDFLNGSCSIGMAKVIGVGLRDAGDELLQAVGTEGAIGIVVGLLLAKGN
jgi:hypothetical protein